MYCIECYLKNGAGTVEAPYILNGKSLCNLCFWDEAKSGVASNLPAKVDPKPQRTRGTRLPDGFMPREENITKIREELGVSSDWLTWEHRKFCDHFYSAPGQRGVKVDWDRTWCNWMRTAMERGGPGGVVSSPGGGPRLRPSRTEEKAQGWMDMEV